MADALVEFSDLIEWSGASADDTVLDVGCGNGLLTCALAGKARCAVGIDASPEAITHAGVTAATHQVKNVYWQLCGADKLAVADASVSLAVSRYVLHHTYAPMVTIAEIVRVCRPGGRIMLVDLALPAAKAKAFDQAEQLRDPSHQRVLALDEYFDAARRHGLADVSVHPYDSVISNVERYLQMSKPAGYKPDEFRSALLTDMGRDDTGMRVRQSDNTLSYVYPGIVLIAKKPSA